MILSVARIPRLQNHFCRAASQPCQRDLVPATPILGQSHHISSYQIGICTIPGQSLRKFVQFHHIFQSQAKQSKAQSNGIVQIQSNPIKTFSRLTVRGVRSSSRTRRSRWTERRRTRGAEGATMGTHPEHNMFHAYIATTSCGAWCNTLSKSSKAKMHIYRSTCNLITTKVTNMSQNMS